MFAWLKARADGRKVRKVHWAVKDERKSATSTQAKHNPFRLTETNETFVTIHLQEHLHLPLLPVSGIKQQIKVFTMNFIRTVIKSDVRASAWKLVEPVIFFYFSCWSHHLHCGWRHSLCKIATDPHLGGQTRVKPRVFPPRPPVLLMNRCFGQACSALSNVGKSFFSRFKQWNLFVCLSRLNHVVCRYETIYCA